MVRFYKQIVIAILTLFSVVSYSQERCEESYIKRIKTDTCDYVEMSTYRFTYY